MLSPARTERDRRVDVGHGSSDPGGTARESGAGGPACGVGGVNVVSYLRPESGVVPAALTVEPGGSRDRGRIRLGVRPEEFVFLFVFDFHSRHQRKNPMAVIEAFRKAFAPSDPARLVIKCVNASFSAGHFDAMRSR